MSGIFESYLAESDRKRDIIIHLLKDGERSISFVFRHPRDFGEYMDIRRAAMNQAQHIRDGSVLEVWRPYIESQGPEIGARSVWMAKLHVGFLKPGAPITTIVPDCKGELDFMKMAKADPFGFENLFLQFKAAYGSSETSEDVDYFREEGEGSGVQPVAPVEAVSEPKDVEPAS